MVRMKGENEEKNTVQCKEKKIISILVNAIPVVWKMLERGNW